MLLLILGDEYAARFLVNNGADVNTVSSDGQQSALHLSAMTGSGQDAAVCDGMAAIAAQLLKHGARINAQDADGKYAITIIVLKINNIFIYKSKN